MDPRIERVLATAVAELGVTELTGRNDGPRIEMYLNRLRAPIAKGDPRQIDRGLAYCAAFVQWVYWMAGLGLPCNFWECRRVKTLAECLAAAGAVLPRGVMPEPGDLLLWVGAGAHGSAGPSGHTSLVREAHQDGPRRWLIHTVGGNEKSRPADLGGVRERERVELVARPSFLLARPVLLFGGAR